MYLSLINQFKKYIEIMGQHDFFLDEIIDIDSCDFLTPTIILPLISLVVNYNKKIKNHKNSKLNEYLLSALSLTDYKETTLPLRRINKSKDNSTQLTNDILSIMNPPKENINALKFIFYEMIANVYDHSKFNNAFVIGQSYPEVNITDYCFMDNGVSIPGSLKQFGHEFDTDCDGIIKAINGLSASDYVDYVERGTGLNNAVNVVTNGGDGTFLIASGNGLVQIDKNEVIAEKIPDNYIKGTLISFRLKSNKIDLSQNLKRVHYNLI